ncbi:MAG: DcaP family trimeric outer membrane transporter [Ruegeria sp.]|uniref:DcaP family trimeric outer membrane transporter n=1 Tax=Ruegeria sp. TaxID=1879320 RepID=UPI00349E7BB1
MKQHRTAMSSLAILASTLASAPLWAQDAQTQAELDALRARVEALEAGGARPSGDLTNFQIGQTNIDIYGYVKADFFYDFDFNQGDTAFVNNIGEPANATDGNFGATLRQSRLGFRTTTQTDIGELRGQLELDLFASGGAAELRLRHANIGIGEHWIIGQDWTNFMPLAQYPTTVEFNGPVGIAFARVPQIRYTNTFGQTTFSASIEENTADSDDPVFTAALSYDTDRYSARVAGLIGTVNSGETDVDQTGITLSGSIRPWQGGLFQATYVTGEALGPLLIGLGDAAVGGVANDVDGYTLEFRQDIGDKWNVGIAYGREEYDLPTSTGTLSFTELETIHVNAFYNVTDNLTLSAEYIRGERNDATTGATFDGDRIQAAIQLNF